jgi:hypothetical protein
LFLGAGVWAVGGKLFECIETVRKTEFAEVLSG